MWSVWSPKDSTRALTSPNDVHHSVNLSNTKKFYYLYLHLILSLFLKKILKHLYFNILKMSIQIFHPDVFRRCTGPPIHANQTNHTTTKNIVLVLCFVTVLCHIINRSYMLNTVQHSYMIKEFLIINEEETKPCWNTQLSTVVCNQTIYALPISSPKMLKVNKNLPFNI